MVNVGDMCEILTNGLYKAVLHRVLASGLQPRTSVAFFFNPSYESDLAPLQSCINPEHPLKYKCVCPLAFHLEYSACLPFQSITMLIQSTTNTREPSSI